MALKFVASFALVAAAILGLVASAPQGYQTSPNYGHHAEDYAQVINEHSNAANAANEYAHAANAAHAVNDFVQSGNNYNHPINNFAHSGEDFLHTTEGYAHVTEDYSRGSSGFVQASPNYGGSEYSTAAPSFSHLVPEFSTVAPGYSRPAFQYSTPAPGFTQSSPEYSTSTPAYGHSVHDYSGTHSPGYSHASSTYTHSTPTYTHSHPTYSPSTATYTQAPPTYTHVTPSYSHAHQDYSNSVTKDGVQIIDADYNANPEYSYSYNVHDERTGDIKNHQETRRGDVVEGSYSLVEADGTRRIVEYTADAQNGFNAIVHKEGTPRVPIAEHYTTDPSVSDGYSPVTHAPSVFGGHADHGSNHINYATPSYGYQH